LCRCDLRKSYECLCVHLRRAANAVPNLLHLLLHEQSVGDPGRAECAGRELEGWYKWKRRGLCDDRTNAPWRHHHQHLRVLHILSPWFLLELRSQAECPAPWPNGAGHSPKTKSQTRQAPAIGRQLQKEKGWLWPLL